MAQRWTETFLHDTDSGVPLEMFTARLCRGGLSGIFADYTMVTTRDHALPALACAKNPTLNRFKDIQCLDATRVTLTTSPHDYINANYVDGFRDPHKFICTQGPLEHTMNDFWRMVWQEGTVVIVALTRFGGGKCETYLPTTRTEKRTYGPITVINLGTRNIRNTYDATALMLLSGATTRRALHICYHAWPDKGTPTDPTEMLCLVDDINFNHHRLVNDGRAKGWLPPVGIHPILVHCSAGVGRTGTLVALDVCMRRLDATAEQPAGPLVDLLETVVKIRAQRAKAVQRPEQYTFLHLAIVEYALRRRLYHDVSVIDMSLFLNPASPPNNLNKQ